MPNSEPVRVAKYALEEYLQQRSVIPVPEWVSEELTARRAGCFVSIHTRDGSLRGCIGTIYPTEENVALEIINNAISASTRDPRFSPVSLGELPCLDISVDILGLPEETTVAELNPKKFGVIVTLGNRKGVLLPDLEGVETLQQQLRIALRKAGIRESEDYRIFRFAVERYY